MIRTLQLVFAPESTWQKIAQSRRSIGRILLLFLLPLMLLSSLAEGYSLEHWGEKRGEFGHPTTYASEQVLIFEAVQLGAGLLVILGGAWILRAFGESFHLRLRFTPCFTVTAYGLSPLYLARFLDAVPVLNTWFCWTVGLCACLYILYQGVGIVLEPQSTQGLGLYLLSFLGLGLLSALAHVVALAVLHGRI